MGESVKGFVIAGPSSGAGKTTVSLALMAALRRRGLEVQPFKCGPDFIDTGHHTRVCCRPSRNLDGWMLSDQTNRGIFHSAARSADVCVVEGVMGLFDGASGKSATGSTAEIAKLLDLPVVLVVDVSAMARSAAAVVHGFETFDPALRLAGVIFNKAGGPGHAQMLREAMESGCSTPLLGCLPRNEKIQIPERYLGLHTAEENLLTEELISLLASIAESNLDLTQLLASLPDIRVPVAGETPKARCDVRIGVARDRAFSFYYEDNLDALRACGAEIVEFSPLSDAQLPASIDALYFGGGYPELHAGQLSGNREMLAAIGRFGDEDSPIYVECGGLMLLAEEVVNRDGQSFPMAGLLPLRVRMTDRLVKFGYAEVTLSTDSLWGFAGAKARGHSFHCSTITEAGDVDRQYHIRYSLGRLEEQEGFRLKNVLASYIHLHFLSNPDLPARLVENIRRAREARKALVQSC
ncbi:MAG TPA: cobyrinate a,c-diamide synthase [Terriglobia bacterium]|nr:cobyrinate a,c-diamide synthase [Terriglobia bacterium]